MKKGLIVLLMLLVFLGLNACQKQQMATSNLDKKLKELNAPAVVALTPDQGVKPLRITGEEAKPCNVKSGAGDNPKDVCPAFREGAEIISRQTIEIIQSKGSICYTFVDPATHHAYQICIPPQ